MRSVGGYRADDAKPPSFYREPAARMADRLQTVCACPGACSAAVRAAAPEPGGQDDRRNRALDTVQQSDPVDDAIDDFG